MSVNLQDFIDEAEKILSQKNSGPSGVLAYTWANAVKLVEHKGPDGNYSFSMPYIDKSSEKPLKPYFAVVKTDRTGIEVAVPPGGTQDLIFDLNGEEQYAELVKPAKQIAFLKDELSIEVSDIDDTKFVAALLSSSKITNLRLESAFSAAARETEEEHGWSYDNNKDKTSLPLERDEELLSKRSFVTNPPTPISQKIFAVGVSSFEGTIPIRTDKIESKIESMLGNAFFEQGDFMSLPDLEEQLEQSRVTLESDVSLPDMAELDYKATISRVDMIRRVQNQLTPNS